MIFVETGKVLVDKKTGAKFKIVKLNGVGEEGVKSMEFWGGVTSCNDPMVYLDQLVLENFIIEDEEKMIKEPVVKTKDSMEFYILKIGSKYYAWSSARQQMCLRDNINDAYKYRDLNEAKSDIKYINDLGYYARSKKRILKAKCEFEEVNID